MEKTYSNSHFEFNLVQNLIINISLLGAIIYSYWMILNKDGLTIGDLVFLTLLLFRIYNSLYSFPKNFSTLKKNFYDSDYIFDLFNKEFNNLDETNINRKYENLNGIIEFDNVTIQTFSGYIFNLLPLNFFSIHFLTGLKKNLVLI
jgi:ABC-type multidrug transport system fused ATPase/permease subunit